MICYLDRSFCSRGASCTCGEYRRVTEEVLASAKKAGLPICYSDMCGEFWHRALERIDASYHMMAPLVSDSEYQALRPILERLTKQGPGPSTSGGPPS